MRTKPKDKKTKVILIIIILVAIGVFFVYWGYSRNKLNFLSKSSQSQSSPASPNDPTTSGTNNGTSSNQENPSSNGQISSTTPDKPVLIKSSGNYGSVPANIVIEFVCQGAPGLKCKVMLSSQSGSNIELPDQDVKDNGRNQYFTSWEWKSITGTWQVYAVVTNQQGKSAESDKQSLEVK